MSKALSNAKLEQEKGKFDLVEMPNLKSKLLSLVLAPHLNETVTGVVHISVEGKCAMDNFETSILEEVEFKCSHLPKQNLIHHSYQTLWGKATNYCCGGEWSV